MELVREQGKVRVGASGCPKADCRAGGRTGRPARLIRIASPIAGLMGMLASAQEPLGGYLVSVRVADKDICVARRGRRGAVSVRVRGCEPLCSYDLEVWQAWLGLTLSGMWTVTPGQVWSALVGFGTRAGGAGIERVLRSMRAISETTVDVGIVKTPNSGQTSGFDGSPVFSGPLMPVSYEGPVETPNGSRAVTGFVVSSLPGLYRCASLAGDAFSIPTSMLNTVSAGSNTVTNVSARSFLIHSYLRDEGDHRFSDLYDLVDLSCPDFDGSSRRSRRFIRRYALGVLDLWLRRGYVESYRVLTASGSEYGGSPEVDAFSALTGCPLLSFSMVPRTGTAVRAH